MIEDFQGASRFHLFLPFFHFNNSGLNTAKSIDFQKYKRALFVSSKDKICCLVVYTRFKLFSHRFLLANPLRAAG